MAGLVPKLLIRALNFALPETPDSLFTNGLSFLCSACSITNIQAIKCFQGAARPKLATAAVREKLPDLGGRDVG